MGGNGMSLNLRQMEVFRAVMREGSITAAAAALNVSQPSLSEVLRHAENRMGLQLFEREKGRLRPTPYALRLRDDVELVFQQVAKVHRTISELKAARDVTLVLGCVYSLSLVLGSKIISELHLNEPRLQLRVHVERRDEMGSKVSNGLIDAAITFLSDVYPGTEAIVLKVGVPRFLCRKSHPLAGQDSVSIRDIHNETFIRYMQHLTMQQLIDQYFASHRQVVRTSVEVEQSVQAWALVQNGQGVAIADPFCELDAFFPEVVSLPVRDAPDIPLQLLVKSGKPLSPMLRKLVSSITAKTG